MGPLEGVKIVELAGIGPAPFCAMLLSDMGAEVIRVDRAANVGRDIGREGEDPRFALLQRGRRNIAVDLKNPDAVAAVLRLIDRADALIEGFRPGRHGAARPRPRHLPRAQPEAGLRPDDRLGPGRADRAHRRARHQLHRAVGRAVFDRRGGRPAGAAAEPDRRFRRRRAVSRDGRPGRHHQRPRDRQGQVIDCSMVEGSASLMMMMYGALAAGAWVEERGSNRTDGGAHYYHVYETKDGEHVAIGSIEPQFYALLLKHTGLEGESLPEQTDRTTWPDMQRGWRASSRQKTREEWTAIMEQTDICFAPVLRMSEAMRPPAQRPSRQLCRGRRHHAAGAGAAFSRHAEPGAAPAGAGRRAHRRDPQGLGLFGRRDRGAAPGRGGRRGDAGG